MDDYRFTLPLPPSINTIYATNKKTGRRFKTKKANDWALEASLLLKSPQIAFKDEVEVFYSFFFKDKKRRDVENYTKVLSDTLVNCRIMEDDSLIIKMTLRKYIDPKCQRVEGLIRPIDEII